MTPVAQLIDVSVAKGYVQSFIADPILKMAANAVLDNAPRVDAVEIPKTGIGDLSDGYHTFNGLYYQRLILFSALVKAHKDCAWKSYKHDDGELCFGGGWFIVGIDTPEGSYTYHYENQYFDLFDCIELPAGKPWDGHAEEDVVRLLSLQSKDAEVVHGRWIEHEDMIESYLADCTEVFYECSACGGKQVIGETPYCPNCGEKMDGDGNG